MNDKERQVVEKLLDDILAAGHIIEIWDEEFQNVSLTSQNKQEILDALGETGEDTLIIWDNETSENIIGNIRLIYDDLGDPFAGVDVINDYDIALEHLLAGAEALANSLE